MRRPPPLGLALWLALGALASSAQQPQTPRPATESVSGLRIATAVRPDTVTVGDPFTSVLRVFAPPGARVEFAGLPVRDTLQPLDTLRAHPSAGGAIAVYSLVAWVAGAPPRASATVRVLRAGEAPLTYRVPLRLPVVQSVLPADARDLRPRPPRPVVPTPAPVHLWLWVLSTLAAGTLLGLWLARLRRPSASRALDPRAEALAALARIERDRHAAADPASLYPAATRALRHYLARISADWGEDLTTTELLDRLSAVRVNPSHLDPLSRLLRHADRVKFAGYAPSFMESISFLAATRRWIESFPRPSQARAARKRRVA